MPETSEKSGKRIAKNTILMYIRMIIFLLIKLYTSRVVLQILGVTDYGIYNLVAGIIILFSFLNASMNGASQRFFNVAMGENDIPKLKLFFTNSLNVHFIIGLCTVILAECIGLYILYNKLNIPTERFNAAVFSFHFAIISSFFTIIRTPFNAIIIAYEQMSFYAYLSIVECILNLAIVYILPYIHFDKLNMYSILMASITALISFIYIFYCNYKYPITKYRLSISKTVIAKILSFSLWSTLSSFSNVVTKQSLNIILNIFYGVTINAATAIMTQVSTAMYSFIQNFQVAVNPQLIKSYASNDWVYLKKLFNAASKISFYLMLILSMPTILCIDKILFIWLDTVPEYTAIFCILSILALLINTAGGPIWTTIQATGKIKKYQTIICVLTLANIPLYYLTLYFNLPVYTTLYFPIITNAVVVLSGMFIIRKEMLFSIVEYGKEVICPILKVSICSLIIPLIFSFVLNDSIPPIKFIISIFSVSVASVLISIFIVGLNPEERKIIFQSIIKKIKK